MEDGELPEASRRVDRPEASRFASSFGVEVSHSGFQIEDSPFQNRDLPDASRRMGRPEASRFATACTKRGGFKGEGLGFRAHGKE